MADENKTLTPAPKTQPKTQTLVTFPEDKLGEVGITPISASTPILGPGNYAMPEGSARPRVLAVEDAEGNITIHGLPLNVGPGQYVVPRAGVTITAKDQHKLVLSAMSKALRK